MEKERRERESLAERLEAWKRAKLAKSHDSSEASASLATFKSKRPSVSLAPGINKFRAETSENAVTCESKRNRKSTHEEHSGHGAVCDDQNVHPNTPNTPTSCLAKQRPEELSSPPSNSATANLEFLEKIVGNLKGELLLKDDQLSSMEIQVQQLTKDFQGVMSDFTAEQQKQATLYDCAKMALEETDALRFENSVQQQRIAELEAAISHDRLDQNEKFNERSKRHKLEIKKLVRERGEYQERANSMIAELQSQMAQLQAVAMARIEELEALLLEEKSRGDALENRLSEHQRASQRQSIATSSSSRRRQSMFLAAPAFREDEEETEREPSVDEDELSESSGDSFLDECQEANEDELLESTEDAETDLSVHIPELG